MLSLASWCQAEVFKWVDEKGKTHFSDQPPAEQFVEAVDVKVTGDGLEMATEQQRRTAQGKANASYNQLQHQRQREAQQVQKEKPPPAMVSGNCEQEYRRPCEVVEKQWRENIAKCKRNRGGDRCDNKDYQNEILRPRTVREQLEIKMNQQSAIIERNRQKRELQNY